MAFTVCQELCKCELTEFSYNNPLRWLLLFRFRDEGAKVWGGSVIYPESHGW